MNNIRISQFKTVALLSVISYPHTFSITYRTYRNFVNLSFYLNFVETGCKKLFIYSRLSEANGYLGGWQQ